MHGPHRRALPEYKRGPLVKDRLPHFSSSHCHLCLPPSLSLPILAYRSLLSQSACKSTRLFLAFTTLAFITSEVSALEDAHNKNKEIKTVIVPGLFKIGKYHPEVGSCEEGRGSPLNAKRSSGCYMHKLWLFTLLQQSRKEVCWIKCMNSSQRSKYPV
ncbi:hypothetical protein ARMGADRAFT_613897 [Armillaria gallica]|uniref:Uncharacterized protein n=1 Tax=Armillaria gallica TaxID=47427 RepID=A0A2H3CYG0_ARMGA|nr:hypothetical protein ARMGADRAFT_613897 [Armillaria gallica]